MGRANQQTLNSSQVATGTGVKSPQGLGQIDCPICRPSATAAGAFGNDNKTTPPWVVWPWCLSFLFLPAWVGLADLRRRLRCSWHAGCTNLRFVLRVVMHPIATDCYFPTVGLLKRSIDDASPVCGVNRLLTLPFWLRGCSLDCWLEPVTAVECSLVLTVGLCWVWTWPIYALFGDRGLSTRPATRAFSRTSMLHN